MVNLQLGGASCSVAYLSECHCRRLPGSGVHGSRLLGFLGFIGFRVVGFLGFIGFRVVIGFRVWG